MSNTQKLVVISFVALARVDVLAGMEPMEVVAQYEKTIQQYRSFDVAYVVTCSWVDGPKRCEWRCDAGGKQRIRVIARTLLPAGTNTTKMGDIALDALYTGEALLQLEDFNPHRRRPLTPATRGYARGSIWRGLKKLEPQQAVSWLLPRDELLLRQGFFAKCGPVRTLGEELQEAINLFGRQAVDCVRETVAGHECWKLSYRYPGCIIYNELTGNRLMGRGGKVALYFDPSVGWLLRRTVFQRTDLVNKVCEVRKFTTLPNGLSFPLEIECQLTYPNGEVRSSLLRVERAAINEPIDESRWVFQFPEGVEVYEGVFSPDENKVLHYVHIVGADGTFVRTYRRDSKEYEQYRIEQLKQHRLAATRSRKGIAASMIVLLLVVLGAAVLWKFRSNLTGNLARLIKN